MSCTPLDEYSRELLEHIKQKSCVLGRTILKSELSSSERRALTEHFGSFSNAIKLSGLPDPNSHEQTKIRIQQKKDEAQKEKLSPTIWKK